MAVCRLLLCPALLDHIATSVLLLPGALVLLCLLTSYSGVLFTRLYTLTPGAGESVP